MRDLGGETGAVRAATAATFSWRRVSGVLLRHLYVLRRSVPRLLELAYWPTVQMVLWGFITQFFSQHSSWVASGAGVLVTAVLLWDVLFRSNLGVALSFMEEMWARNLGQIFVSPLRPIELVVGLAVMGGVRTLIAVVPAAVLAMPLFDVSVFALGLPLAAFFANLLIFGWSLGMLVSGLILRLGLGAESLAWVVIFALAPLSGVYYPIDVLPSLLQPIAYALPTAWVFEGMRAVLFGDGLPAGHLAAAVLLNALYACAAGAFFLLMVQRARERGLLLQQGE
ncbi:MAG: ABC transporter permease [Rhodospirillales bacterium]|jgi:ABC-2 type transport system permease protein|nr:ABC transporter permease [Rhodospirillales bacterium]